MLRPQLKDMYQGGHQLDMKKGKKVNPPPMNASPGELRLWRKLNGCLTEEEKKVDALEHAKAKSRANLAGKPRNGLTPNAPLRRGPSEDILIGEERRQQELMQKASSSPASSARSRTTPSRPKATPVRTRTSISKQTPKAASPRLSSRAGSPRPAAKTPVLDAAKQQQEKRRAAAKEAAEKAAMLRQKQAAAAARKRQEAAALKAAQIEESADCDEQYEHEYADQSVQQQQHHEQHEGEYEEADYDDADEAADAADAAIEAVDAVQGSDYGMDDERDAGSPESDASSAVVTGAAPKERASAPKQLSASKPATEGVSTLAHIQEMCASLSLSEKKKLKGWLGGRIEVEELQDLFDRS